MALLSSFFKEKKTSSSNSLVSEKLTIETLRQLIPIRNLSEDKLQSFALENKSEVLSKGKTLFSIDETDNSAIYLLRGAVVLADAKGQTYEVDSTTAKAKFPLSSGIKHNTTATTKSDVSFLRVSQKIMSINLEQHRPTEIIVPEELNDNRILQTFLQHFYDDDLEIPSLPGIAIKLRKAMQKEIGIDEAVKIIQLDPVISAKLIEVANCPLYISVSPAKSCFEAVKRIGLNATRSLVISLSIKNIFKNDSPKIKKRLDKLWKNSLYLSCLSHVLASVSKQQNPEEALLAGLICDIGAIPFLNFVSNLPEDYYNEDEIMTAIPVVKGVVGASILEKWGFAEDFIKVTLTSEDWFQHSEDSLSYTDIVVLSRLHSKIGKKTPNLPSITSIPAASKLKNITLSPENSLSILHDAKDKINDALKTFSS
ncbi:MAG: HDOD domain-containing protein [Methylococcaceae bacterium]